MLTQFGPLELIIVLAIVLLIFGPKRLPGLGKQLGRGMREFKESITGGDKHEDSDAEKAEHPATLSPASETSLSASGEQREVVSDHRA